MHRRTLLQSGLAILTFGLIPVVKAKESSNCNGGIAYPVNISDLKTWLPRGCLSRGMSRGYVSYWVEQIKKHGMTFLIVDSDMKLLEGHYRLAAYQIVYPQADTVPVVITDNMWEASDAVHKAHRGYDVYESYRYESV